MKLKLLYILTATIIMHKKVEAEPTCPVKKNGQSPIVEYPPLLPNNPRHEALTKIGFRPLTGDYAKFRRFEIQRYRIDVQTHIIRAINSDSYDSTFHHYQEALKGMENMNINQKIYGHLAPLNETRDFIKIIFETQSNYIKRKLEIEQARDAAINPPHPGIGGAAASAAALGRQTQGTTKAQARTVEFSPF